MKEDLTWIVNILDESGSMSGIKDDTVGSFNEFINEQKKVEGLAYCTLVKFNTKIEKVYENKSIQDVDLIDGNSYKPSTYTRLYDAIGHTIDQIKSKIKEIKEEERPGKVLFVILTDGKENRSVDFSKEKVFSKIAKREKKGWSFIYLGANQDAMVEGEKIGIGKMKTVTWEASAQGVNTVYKAASNYTTKFRNAKNAEDLKSLDLNAEFNEVVDNKS